MMEKNANADDAKQRSSSQQLVMLHALYLVLTSAQSSNESVSFDDECLIGRDVPPVIGMEVEFSEAFLKSKSIIDLHTVMRKGKLLSVIETPLGYKCDIEWNDGSVQREDAGFMNRYHLSHLPAVKSSPRVMEQSKQERNVGLSKLSMLSKAFVLFTASLTSETTRRLYDSADLCCRSRWEGRKEAKTVEQVEQVEQIMFALQGRK
ncbi:hypothetical protein GUITHDRAFT_106329 [Guillardia theta CCMP2712]|uniref:Uncharacterized protein n=1 Tax=Guillardia theta (strain CCMP2712) TaxID=905079 RepID=L1JI75_GUITC|nr:hypothetical protein GUITHDRAFT_106329 [Guillardia theta CCMP2712]EKX47775.1 hypothetical protein GUITHDRAFT_106329 [Guillardia theta CCMP2712]|eukprot:XP_005834755.1 hypothetical protein GUITHDRAFT_106329 [Guillardia theta CCMP2712]